MQKWLVRLDYGDVVGLLVLHEEARVRGLGVQGVEGDHGVGHVEPGKQGPEDSDFVGLAVHLALGGDQAGAGHRGEQVDLGAVGAAGAPHRLAVHGQGTMELVDRVLTGWRAVRFAGGEPGADRGVQGVAVDALQDPAHSGFSGGGRAAGFTARAAQGGEHSGWCVRSPLCDRGQGLGAGQDRAGGQGEDEGEGMAASLGPARIGHRGETVQQARVFLGRGRPGSSELAQTGRDGR